MINVEPELVFVTHRPASQLSVSLLTGGGDRPYVVGMTQCLTSGGLSVDVIGSDDLDLAEIRNQHGVRFLNLRGSVQSDVPFMQKISRVLLYYLRLLRYAATAKPKIVHILWNNKFEHLDRTLLMLYYKCLGKRVVLTAHNVNTCRRDSKDTCLNRLTLRVQYRLADSIFVHTNKMKHDLARDFAVAHHRVTVIPFGINDTVPTTSLTPASAKQRLGISASGKTILFFGRITPYKGLDVLLHALKIVLGQGKDYRLIIAGRPDRCDEYWSALRTLINEAWMRDRVIVKAEFIPDEETEVYFKAADVLVLPYRDIYQSGVLFLGYSFGLPAIATDIGSFREDILDGRTGLLCKPSDPEDLARTLTAYFESDMYGRLDHTRYTVRRNAEARYSWELIGKMIRDVYTNLK